MPAQLYYITDRRQFPGDDQEQSRQLLKKIAECAAAGVDLIQLREKDLSIRALEKLAYQAMAALGASRTRLLINSRTDVALACGAHGVHLPANDLLSKDLWSKDLSASEVRAIFSRANVSAPTIGVSAHSLAEVVSAETSGANLAVFGPVFEKGGTANAEGLGLLRQICHRDHAPSSHLPVFALGGITFENAEQCLDAGAAGIAAIRLFQQHDVEKVVARLRRR